MCIRDRYSGTQSSGLTAAVTASRAVVDVVIRNDSNTTVGAAPSVGDKLTAVPSPAQATVTYQWYRDGAAISGATSASYTCLLYTSNTVPDVWFSTVASFDANPRKVYGFFIFSLYIHNGGGVCLQMH